MVNPNNNTLIDNSAYSNSGYGFNITSATGCTLKGNKATNNGWGIRMYAGYGHTLKENIIDSNDTYGIYLSGQRGITVTQNVISKNFKGIYITCAGVTGNIFNNNLINNTTQVIFQPSGECGHDVIFNLEYPIGGNYWSDWTSPDNDQDGFVDDAYEMEYCWSDWSGYQTGCILFSDYYPWVRPITIFDSDGDGIRDEVDENPNMPVIRRFSDKSLGGSTSGQIRGLDAETTIDILDAPASADGLLAIVSGSGVARVRIDGSIGEYYLNEGQYILTSGSVILSVVQGLATIEYSIGGEEIIIVVNEGAVVLNEIVVEDELQELVVDPDDGSAVTVKVNGEPLPEDESFTFIKVSIDIKPGSYPNCFNNNGHGVIPVAILSSDTFDATQVDPITVKLDSQEVRIVGRKGNLQAHIEDVNNDGLDDLMLQIEDVDETYQEGDTIATLTGETFDDSSIFGTDSICIVP
jgi:parallel beta-helix repeat protein